MFGSVPGNIIELDRLLIILVAVTAEFERLKRCLGPNPIGNNMIQGPGLWIGSMFQTEGTGAGKKTRSTLSMYIRPRLKGTICLLYTSPSPRDRTRSRMPSSA